MDPSPRAWQKQEDAISVFWDRKISPLLTRAFVAMGITPNQATLIWGAISAANAYTVYRAITGDYWLVPAVWAVFVVASVIDCADGEVARATGNVNPIAGKLLDGICHRATEYALLGAFGGAAATLTGSPWVLPITAALLAGDAMQSYVYERRLSILRLQQRESGRLRLASDALYRWGTPWTRLSARQKISTITGTFHYKSVYPVIVCGSVSGRVLLIALAVLAVYKHLVWVRLMMSTIAIRPREAQATPVTAPDPPLRSTV